MKRYKDILKTLGNELDDIETRIEDVLIRAEKGIRLAKKALQETRKLIDDHEFKSEHDEITFFKKIKPSLNSKLIYYVKLFNIESRRPRSSKKSQTKYLNGHIDKLQSFFNDNLEFYHYYRRNATSLDEQYFLRGNADIRLLPDSLLFYTDERFSTSHDSTVATIIAYDMLIVHLKTEIDKLENNNSMEQAMNPFSQQSHLFWTAHKTDLIELIYALHSCGAVNSGTADIKEMAAAFERLYNIDLGNYYHTFVEIRSRKSNNTKFLDKLKMALLKRYEDSDE